MKIKNYVSLVLIIGFIGIQAAAQRIQPKPTRGGLSPSERVAAVDTTLETTCSQTTPKIARSLSHDARVFSADRIETTLTGVWQGRVSGNYDKQFLAEQFGSTRAAPEPKPGAPVWTYVSCGREGYVPRHPAQIHEFHKVSDNIEDAREILRTSTGQTFANKGELVLADVWQQLVDTKYFDDPARSLAYAGGFFKPFSVGNIPVSGGSLLEMSMQAEYRGSGETAAKFDRGVPIFGVERGRMLGVTADSGALAHGRGRRSRQAAAGDFLVASPGLNGEMVVEKDADANALAAEAASSGSTSLSGTTKSPGTTISFAYDKVVIGPLAPSATASASVHHKSRK